MEIRTHHEMEPIHRSETDAKGNYSINDGHLVTRNSIAWFHHLPTHTLFQALAYDGCHSARFKTSGTSNALTCTFCANFWVLKLELHPVTITRSCILRTLWLSEVNKLLGFFRSKEGNGILAQPCTTYCCTNFCTSTSYIFHELQRFEPYHLIN